MTYTTVGAVIWVTVWSIVGGEAGSHVTAINRYAGYVAAALAVGVVLTIALHVVRSRRHNRSATSEQS
jgi:membrane protein DedA with SNARE-associated domain